MFPEYKIELFEAYARLSRIKGRLSTKDIEIAQRYTRYQEKGYERKYAYTEGKWDGFTHLTKKHQGTMIIPIGMVTLVIHSFLKEHNVEDERLVFDIVDCRVEPTVEPYDPADFPFTGHAPYMQTLRRIPGTTKLGGGIVLRSYQERMVQALLAPATEGSALRWLSPEETTHLASGVSEIVQYRCPHTGTIKSSTGSGKTIASAGLVARSGLRTLFLVSWNILVKQTWHVYNEILHEWANQYGWKIAVSCEGDFQPGEIMVGGTATLVNINRGPDRLYEGMEKKLKALNKMGRTFLSGKAEVIAICKLLSAVLHDTSGQAMVNDVPRWNALCDKLEEVTWTLPVKRSLSNAEIVKAREKAEASMIGMINSLRHFPSKYEDACAKRSELLEYLASVDLLILDEAHSGAADGPYEIICATKAKYRCAMSGTPVSRSDGANLKVLAGFEGLIANISNKEMLAHGVVPMASIYIYDVPVEAVSLDWDTKYADVVAATIINYAPRNNIISMIVQEIVRRGENVIVLFLRHEHGDVLSSILSDGDLFCGAIPHMKVDGRTRPKKRDEALRMFRAGEIQVLLASDIFGTGLNIKEGFNHLIVCGGGEAETGTLQRLGRLLRGTGQVRLHDFADGHHKIPARHSLSRIEQYAAEDCFPLRVVQPHEVQTAAWEAPLAEK